MTTDTPQSPLATTQQKEADTNTPAPQRWKPKVRPLPDTLAWTRAFFLGLEGLVRYTLLYLMGRTPPTVNYAQGATTAFAHCSGKGLTLAQKRASFVSAISSMEAKTGLGTPELKAQWMRYVQKDDWKACWIPFQDQIHKVKAGQPSSNQQEEIEAAKARTDYVSQSRIGEGCDIVVFYTHGGGFVNGHPSQSLNFFKLLMRKAQRDHDLKVGFFSIEYRLSPETPFPGGLNDCLSAYHALIKEYGVDPKRVVFAGDSAGGNLSYSLALKLRDECADELPLPAAIYSSSPYFPGDDKIKPTIFDMVHPEEGDFFVDAYTQNRPENLASPYYTPFNAKTLTGLPPTLIMWGSVEVLGTWIERFVDLARRDGVEVETMCKPDRAHCWFMIDPVSTVEDREEAAAVIAQYLVKFKV
ncbi:hypothetical protein BGX23_000558 [Mortierella sp. AD031]|nr:hypothetical protein BGX23_000558 [Mortierella sp. AD031]